MILGTGVDIIEVDRVYKELCRHGDRFCQRVFTEDEISYCSKRTSAKARAQCFAARFAAKESFFKALGTGLRDGLQWTDVDVVHDPLGRPQLRTRNRADELVREIHADIHVTLSHGHSYAVAVVVLESHP